MALRLKNGLYQCMFCNFTDKISTHVYSHMQEVHDYLLVPFTREELVKLVQFIFTKDEQLITEAMYKRIKDYSKYKIKSLMEND